MEKYDKNFIKKRRIALSLSMREMAERLNFKNASTYYKYETGEYSVKADMLPVLANILKCNISDFFCE